MSLRDLHVGIYFDDGVTRPLSQIDNRMNRLERGFVDFGGRVDNSSSHLQTMGATGLNATSQLTTGFSRADRELTGFNDEVNDSHSDLRRMGMVGDSATDELENGFGRAEREASDFNREARNSGDALGGIKRGWYNTLSDAIKELYA